MEAALQKAKQTVKQEREEQEMSKMCEVLSDDFGEEVDSKSKSGTNSSNSAATSRSGSHSRESN